MKNVKDKLALDVHSKVWWTSITALLIVLAQQVAHMLGWEISSQIINGATGIINTLLTLGGLLGIITDTSAKVSSDKDEPASTPASDAAPTPAPADGGDSSAAQV
jgi:uncharacterized membrane protein